MSWWWLMYNWQESLVHPVLHVCMDYSHTLWCAFVFLTVDCWQINRPPRIVSHLKFVSRLDRLSLQFTGEVFLQPTRRFENHWQLTKKVQRKLHYVTLGPCFSLASPLWSCQLKISALQLELSEPPKHIHTVNTCMRYKTQLYNSIYIYAKDKYESQYVLFLHNMYVYTLYT